LIQHPFRKVAMPRSLSLLVLLAMAGCAPVPELLSPRVKPPPAPKPWPGATFRVAGPGVDHSRGMPVVVPDTEKLERMPVAPLADSVRQSAP
jgi:hypothetical protein